MLMADAKPQCRRADRRRMPEPERRKLITIILILRWELGVPAKVIPGMLKFKYPDLKYRTIVDMLARADHPYK